MTLKKSVGKMSSTNGSATHQHCCVFCKLISRDDNEKTARIVFIGSSLFFTRNREMSRLQYTIGLLFDFAGVTNEVSVCVKCKTYIEIVSVSQ